MYICPNCCTENLDTAKFCYGCGTKIEQPTPIAEVPVMVTPVEEIPTVSENAPIEEAAVAETVHYEESSPFAEQPLVQPMQPAPVYEQTLEQPVFVPSTQNNNDVYSTSVENTAYAAPTQPVVTYEQPQYTQPQYTQPQYTQPQYTQPQYTQPQYTQPQYTQPQYVPQYTPPTNSNMGGTAQGLSLCGFITAMLGIIAAGALLVMTLTDEAEWGRWGMLVGFIGAGIAFVPSLIGLILACNAQKSGAKGNAVKNGKVVGILGIVFACILGCLGVTNMTIYQSEPNGHSGYGDYINDYDYNDYLDDAQDYLDDYSGYFDYYY